MNLLNDAWIPVRADGGTGPFRQISYEELLCGSGNWQVSLPRDDLEMACVQLLICMTQVIFLPKDIEELQRRIECLFEKAEFAQRIDGYRPWFDLEHKQHPFMQVVDTGANKTTPLQKLFVGMPAGNNHAFFNDVGEVGNVCPACAAIALFNLCSNAPNISGKHMGGLRGSGPISTFVNGRDLRETIWKNVLARDVCVTEMNVPLESKPTWVEPIKAGEHVIAFRVGLLRGLFWTPILIRLNETQGVARCDSCGASTQTYYRDCWLGSDFKFEVEGEWPHPHTPRQWVKNKKQDKDWFFLSFRTLAPAWTQLAEFVLPSESVSDAPEGYVRAPVVTQFVTQLSWDERTNLIVGGYRVKQAKVEQRRHELISLAEGWFEKEGERLRGLIQIGRDANSSLRWALHILGKSAGLSHEKPKRKRKKGVREDYNHVGIHDVGERDFYNRSEPLIHEYLGSASTWRVFALSRKQFARQVADVALEIFKRLTDPYYEKAELIPDIAVARRHLSKDLQQLIEGV